MQIIYKSNKMQIEEGTRVKDALEEEIKKQKDNVIACKFNNEVKSLDYRLNKDGDIELVYLTDKDGMRVYMRGIIYIVSKAFKELFPKCLITVNYQLYNSMFCNIYNLEITDEVIKKVDSKAREIIEKDLSIEKRSMTRQEAEEFYKKNDTLMGKLQLDMEEKEEVTLYYCEEYFNYFFGVMPISTGVIKNFEIIKYDDGILIRYPNEKHPEKLVEFKETPKLYNTLKEYDDLHKILKIDTIYKLNKVVDENKIKDYILLDEALHEKKIAHIADEIVKNKGIKLITIAGPSSSGKTTFSKRLEIQMRINGLKPVTISVDNYFVEREATPLDENGKYDFECIEAIDTKLLNQDLIKLLNGEEIDAPTFNFHTGHKEYRGNKMKLGKDEVLVMEGIHCLNDELTYLIPKEQKYKIYISALTVLNMDYYNRISTTDTRLIRRIVRDNQFRGYSAKHTLEMWESVKAGELKNIFKFQEEADAMFNSSLIYELGVLKKYAEPLLKEIEVESPLYSEAKRLLTMLKYFKSIPDKYIPIKSLIREFIGGSVFEETD